jgi:nickel-type superoxide dismutase maturation protease
MNLPPPPIATAAELLRWIFRLRRRVRVVGSSMEPSLYAGDVVLIDRRAYREDPPAELDLVVARHPQQPELEIIKRVEFIDESGVYLRSDNADAADAADSRRFGMIAFEQVVGRVTAKVGR